jgi:Type IV secretion system pilin
MKKIFSLVIVVVGLSFLAVSTTQAAPLNCGSYGVQVSNNTTLPNGCPTARPVTNNKALSSQGFHCCMTAAKSAELDADYAANGNNNGVPGVGGGTGPIGGNGGNGVGGAPGGGGGGGVGGASACAAPGACRSTSCNANETTVSGFCPNSGVCCAPAGTGTPGGGGGVGGGAGGTMTVIEFPNPLQYDTVEGVFTSVITTIQSIVVLLALVFIIIGALIYITSAGDSKRIDWAKKAISAALIGLVIIMVAPSFLKEIANVLGWNDVPAAAAQALSISQIATRVLNFLLSIIGIIAIIMFLIGSIMYLTSAGDDKKASTAKDIVKAAIIGMIVAFSALVIVRQLADFFI